MIDAIKNFVSFYVIYYQPYILIYWTIFLIIYFSIRYNLYRNPIFYFFIFFFIFGFLLFKEMLSDNLVLVEKQRVRYISLAKNFVENRTFAHLSKDTIIFDRHLAYCSIPLIFGIVFFGLENIFKFTYWYNFISVLLLIYLGYKIFRDTKKILYYPFVLILILPFLYHETLNPYNYPEFSNMLIFSIFTYLLFFKKDERALLILPLLLSSGNEYIFFFIFTVPILYSIDKENLVKRSLFYYFVFFLVAFPYIFLTFYDHILGDIEFFFKKEIYYNTLNTVIYRLYSFYPFIAAIFLSIVNIFVSIKIKSKEQLIEIIPSLFYLTFLTVVSGWGVTPYDYCDEHFLPNLLPIIVLISNKFNKLSTFLSIPSIYLMIVYFKFPKFYYLSFADNLSLFKDILKFIPKDEMIVFPRETEYRYFMLLGIKLKNFYTFSNVNYDVLKNKYYLVTTSFMENNNNFNFDLVHREFFRFCNLVHENLQWKIYICQGYDEKLISTLETFRKQRFG